MIPIDCKLQLFILKSARHVNEKTIHKCWLRILLVGVEITTVPAITCRPS